MHVHMRACTHTHTNRHTRTRTQTDTQAILYNNGVHAGGRFSPVVSLSGILYTTIVYTRPLAPRYIIICLRLNGPLLQLCVYTRFYTRILYTHLCIMCLRPKEPLPYYTSSLSEVERATPILYTTMCWHTAHYKCNSSPSHHHQHHPHIAPYPPPDISFVGSGKGGHPH